MAASWAAALDLARIARNTGVALADIYLSQQSLALSTDGPTGTDEELSEGQKQCIREVMEILRKAADDLGRWA